MAITTYAELKAALTDWGKRPDDTDMLDTFIDLAEADIWESLRIRGMETRATGNLSGRTLALPSDFLEARKFRLTSDPSRELLFKTPESLRIVSGSGVPKHWTITDQIEFDKTPDSTYGYELTYYKSLTALSAANTSNSVLTRYPKVYLYGGLKHYFDWAQQEEKAIKYGALFEKAVKDANRNDKSGRYPSGKSMMTEASTP